MLQKEDIDKLKKGDRSAQEKVYKYYAPKLKSVCLRYSNSIFDAEDIFQEAFVKIFSRIEQYQYDLSFNAWVRKIVVNTAIDHYKKNLRFSNHKNIDDHVEFEGKPAEAFDDLSTEELLAAVQKLPEGYRIIFNMYEVEGYSHQEIAQMLDIAEGTSKSQLYKAKRYLQNLLKKNNKIIEHEPKRA
ncbi:MAG: RNA polymerase sigma factor [Cytophagales bacterium]